MPFLNVPTVKDLINPETNLPYKGKSDFQVLQENLIWESGTIGGGLHFIVPKGFETNYASTPKFLHPIFPPRGAYNRSAVLHDFLYSKLSFVEDRFLADCMFRVTMKELNVPLWRRVIMYYAVRLFGWFRWKKV